MSDPVPQFYPEGLAFKISYEDMKRLGRNLNIYYEVKEAYL